MPATIVCISAPSGGGKTTIVQQLIQRVPNAVALYFDDYDERVEGANLHPVDLQQWLAAGADYNAWQMPGLLRDLQQLKTGQSLSPQSGASPPAPALVWLDAAMGRANVTLRPYIDFMVFIDTPLDVAMARRIQRDYADHTYETASTQLAQLHAMTSAYLTWARAAYLELSRQVKPRSDLVLDGCLAVDVLSTCIVDAVQQHLRRNNPV